MGSNGQIQALTALVSDYIRVMIPGESVRLFLEASFDAETQAPRLAAAIESNPLYAHYLQKLDILQEKVKQWHEEFPEEKGTPRFTQFITALLGRAITRNAIASIWVNRHGGAGIPRKEGVPFLILPRAQIRYALTAWDYCEENEIAEKDPVYMAALCFDFVGAVMEKKGGPVKAEKKYLEETWAEAMKAGKIAHQLAAVSKNLALAKFALPATLLVHLGKVLMAATHTAEWKEFNKLCDAHESQAMLARRVLERRKFAFTHSDAAALCAMLFPILHPAEKAIRTYEEAYLLKNTDPHSFHLAAIVSAATSLGRAKPPAVLTAVQKQWLRDTGISDDLLKSALVGKKGGK